MAKNLTALAVEKMKPGATRREAPDGLVTGLYLIVQTSGKMSWALRYRASGKSRKLTLGRWPALDLAKARKAARLELEKVAKGEDPAGAKKAQKVAAASGELSGESLFKDVVDAFIDRHVKPKRRPESQRQTVRMLKGKFATLNGRRLADIKREDVKKVIDGIVASKRGVTANRSLTVVSFFFSWCIQEELIEVSPASGVWRPHEEKPRERILDKNVDDEKADAVELRQVWRACDSLHHPYGAIVRLLILTGARRREIGGMKWAEIDFVNRVWTLPAERAKNGNTLELPLSNQAISILQSIPRINKAEYVFTLDGDSPVDSYFGAKQKLDKLLPDIKPWVLHDLRRSTASGMARIGVPLHVIEKCLNHASGSFSGIKGVYQRHKFKAEMKDAMTRWGAYVERQTGDASKAVAHEQPSELEAALAEIARLKKALEKAADRGRGGHAPPILDIASTAAISGAELASISA
ncbi:Site-specific recombinase XerD [Rhizobiales bacterium GAS191]|nr:Site-specific recombinase XerD [Rhizobiales bacterium GAS191]